MQIADGHQCAVQQPEGLNPVKQKAKEPVEVVNERYEHQDMQFTLGGKLAALEEANKECSVSSVSKKINIPEQTISGKDEKMGMTPRIDRQYTMSQMSSALEAVSTGGALRQMSKLFNIPYCSLDYKARMMGVVNQEPTKNTHKKYTKNQMSTVLEKVTKRQPITPDHCKKIHRESDVNSFGKIE